MSTEQLSPSEPEPSGRRGRHQQNTLPSHEQHLDIVSRTSDTAHRTELAMSSELSQIYHGLSRQDRHELEGLLAEEVAKQYEERYSDEARAKLLTGDVYEETTVMLNHVPVVFDPVDNWSMMRGRWNDDEYMTFEIEAATPEREDILVLSVVALACYLDGLRKNL